MSGSGCDLALVAGCKLSEITVVVTLPAIQLIFTIASDIDKIKIAYIL